MYDMMMRTKKNKKNKKKTVRGKFAVCLCTCKYHGVEKDAKRKESF